MDNENPPVMSMPAPGPAEGSNQQYISVIDPITPAIEHVRMMLFRPFDLSKWMILGFCAWLATLGQGGGGGGNGGGHGNFQGFSDVKEAVMSHLPLIIILAAIIVPIIIIVGLVLCWLRSRGQFMFVHCIAGNKAEVVVPWNKFSRHGNSLFLFRIVLGLIYLVVIGLPIAVAIAAGIALHATGIVAAAVAALIAAIFTVIALAVLFSVISKFTADFVVPIMLLHTASSVAGWRTFLTLLGANKARMFLYILFQILISVVIGFIVFAICLIGCCCCCVSVLLFVPYIGTVILLPIIAFKRAYSLFYLRQFGPQFDVLSPQAS
jgi:hypothetical protein